MFVQLLSSPGFILVRQFRLHEPKRVVVIPLVPAGGQYEQHTGALMFYLDFFEVCSH